MYCTTCGFALPSTAGFCPGCGTRVDAYAAAAAVGRQAYGQPPHPGGGYAAPAARATDYGPGTVTHWLLPVGRSWQSLVAGYVALFAIVLWPLGPVALGLGAWALVRAAREKAHGTGRAVFAVIVGLLATFLLAVVVLSA